MRIYIAGPYSAATPEDVHRNVCKATDAATALLLAGHEPFLPHLSHWWHLHSVVRGTEIPYERWLAWAMSWVRQCEGFLYLSLSPGADRELALAQELGLVIFRTVEEAVAYKPRMIAISTTGPTSNIWEIANSGGWEIANSGGWEIANRGGWDDSDACVAEHLQQYDWVSQPE